MNNTDRAKRIGAGLGLTGVLAAAAVSVTTFEGRSLVAYPDVGGVPTICEGITRNVYIGEHRTDAQCDAALVQELNARKAFVEKYVTRPMTVNEEAGLISFTYNVGGGSFLRSTLLRKLNAGDRVGACNEMLKWVYVGPNKVRGLVRRRQEERQLCLS